MKFQLAEAYYDKYIDFYHGTPKRLNALGIVKNGLKWSPSNIATFSDEIGYATHSEMSTKYHRSYLARDIRACFEIASGYWNYGDPEPYGYIFKFKVKESELFDDEDALELIIANHYLNGTPLYFDESKIEQALDEDKYEEFMYYVNAAKEDPDLVWDLPVYLVPMCSKISPLLTREEQNLVVRHSKTASVDKVLYPVKIYRLNVEKYEKSSGGNISDFLEVITPDEI